MTWKWTRREGSCVVCGEGDRVDSPFCEDEFYPGVYFHLRCMSTPEAVAWNTARRVENPAFDRWFRVMGVRDPIVCPHCGKGMERIPKGIGMGASQWPVHCTRCHRMGRRNFSPYLDREAWNSVADIRHDFVMSRALEGIEARLCKVAAAYDHLVNAEPCACGGRFSLAATARCLECDGAVPESWFHWFEEPMSAERRRRIAE